jgi:hypothetical protein
MRGEWREREEWLVASGAWRAKKRRELRRQNSV